MHRRPSPIDLRPEEHVSPFFDRETEIHKVIEALKSGESVNVYGEDGIGKTSFLEYLAHHVSYLPAFCDGVVYEPASGFKSADDFLLGFLFEEFYEGTSFTNATARQRKQMLREIKALIILDNLELPRGEIELLLKGAGNCRFLYSSRERSLWGRGSAFRLDGLPKEDALKLVEDELGHSLASHERDDAQFLCTALKGYPYWVRCAISFSKDEERPIAEIADLLRQADDPM